MLEVVRRARRQNTGAEGEDGEVFEFHLMGFGWAAVRRGSGKIRVQQ